MEQRDSGLIADEVLTAEEEGDELLLMGLRLAEGIDPRRYERLSGRVLDRRRVADLIGHDLVHEGADGRLRATPRGFLVLDAVVADLAA